ncbi:TRAF-type zinc finger protein (macronuclear) [Tetrahymena thermophila SB210]|uniref:TRAF-type zinc finger protein n=1 Tax=Tetrahymena thermophila (strain SB210) TaxID=312017 RepID=Q23K07_TETTS|nr:TRAF-type zinc finger protein [Tetrahymena thermophila SB210]EAR97036.1 TRAF-type zinc finger protein [Tetrahymena thermophila SB210]|eukprot:XP_001017281.1 TRAF-type zinc finger protein [Tetrahymena thermophila SB210]
MIQGVSQEIQIQEELIDCEHKDLIHNVLCKICFMLLQKPILVCTNCGYFACKGCIKKWQKNTLNQTCPQKCSQNSTFLEKQIPQLEKVFNWLSIKCPNSLNEDPSQQCNVVMKYNEINQHVPNCQFTLVKCRFANCQKLVCKKDLDHHQKNCEFNKIKCKYCLNPLKIEEQDKHLQECDHRIISCPNQGCSSKMQYLKRNVHLDQCKFRLIDCTQCQQKIQFKDLDHHTLNLCINRLIQCPQCSSQIIKKDEQYHLKQDCPSRNVFCENCLQGMKFTDLQRHSENDCIQALKQRLDSAQAKKDECIEQIKEISQYLNQNQNI